MFPSSAAILPMSSDPSVVNVQALRIERDASQHDMSNWQSSHQTLLCVEIVTSSNVDGNGYSLCPSSLNLTLAGTGGKRPTSRKLRNGKTRDSRPSKRRCHKVSLPYHSVNSTSALLIKVANYTIVVSQQRVPSVQLSLEGPFRSRGSAKKCEADSLVQIQ